jgi:hypothetical protein
MKTLLTAYRLYLAGYRRFESGGDVPQNYSVLREKEDDPYPVTVFGMAGPVSSGKLSNYLNGEFYHYLTIYKNIKNYGLPYASWLDCPAWLLDLVGKFDGINEEYSRYKTIKGIL